MVSKVYLRLRNRRYEFMVDNGGRPKCVMALRQGDMSTIIPLSDDTSSDIRDAVSDITNTLTVVQDAELSALSLEIIQKLNLLQQLVGHAGPGSAGALFTSLETTLRSSYKKIKRMNDLIIRKS